MIIRLPICTCYAYFVNQAVFESTLLPEDVKTETALKNAYI